MGPGRLIALDIDGDKGRSSLALLESEYGPLPETATSSTGREDGGEHRLFQVPEGFDMGAIKNAIAFRPGLDVRAQGGQIVVAPSIHQTGRAYRWTKPGPVAELPRWLFDLFTAPKARLPPAEALREAAPSRTSAGRPEARTRAEAWLRRVPGAVAGQSGHLATYNAALGLVVGFQLHVEEALAMLERIHNPRCEPRWSREELLHKVMSAAKNERNLIPGYLVTEHAPGFVPSVPQPAQEPEPRAPSRSLEQGTEPPETPAEGPSWKKELHYDRHRLRKNLHNVALLLTHAEGWAGCLAYDEFADRLTMLTCPPSHDGLLGETWPRPWRDADDILVALWLQRSWEIEASPDLVGHAVTAVAARHRIHPVRDYLEGLRWDGQRRLSTWLSTYLGARQTAYVAAVGTCTLRAAVARIYQPGCKVDTMLVLQGEQSAYKSTAIRVLCGERWFTDDLADFGSKDAAMQLRGAWFLEVAELAGMGRAEVERVKAFFSRAVERYRSAYGRHVQEQPRQCVFFGTTNADTYLKDETGNRRFWPVACAVVAGIDLPGLARDRDQLWAEAVADFKTGQRWHLDRVEDEKELREATAAQESVRERDPWESLVQRYLAREQPTFVTSGDLLRVCEIEPSRWGVGEQRRVGAIIRGLGWTRGRRGTGNEKEWGYTRPYLGADPPGDR